MRLQGRIKVGERTKNLVNYLSQDDIAVIHHDDIDEMAAIALARTGTKAVVNTGRTMTGRFDPGGAAVLLRNNMIVVDTCLPFDCFRDNDTITIMDSDIIFSSFIYKDVCSIINWEYIRRRQSEAKMNEEAEIKKFINNTIKHAAKELEGLVCFSGYPKLDTKLEGRHAVVVVRNGSSLEELLMLKDYIERYDPVFIGVDGGADLIINCGYIPDILMGDMDSVSDIGIYKSRELVLHSYEDGYCPCLERIAPMNIPYKFIAMAGTSEDTALMLAYHKKAELIVLVGGHSSMDDFLCKGRSGMASTFITRTLTGSRLVDCKGLGIVAAAEKEGKSLRWARM